jgi:uncharacterized protein YcbX
MAISEDVGSVATLWRFPVKSMGGEQLQDVEVTEREVLGDHVFRLGAAPGRGAMIALAAVNSAAATRIDLRPASSRLHAHYGDAGTNQFFRNGSNVHAFGSGLVTAAQTLLSGTLYARYGGVSFFPMAVLCGVAGYSGVKKRPPVASFCPFGNGPT